MYYRQKNQA